MKIQVEHPYITVYDAFSFYYDHQKEIEEEIELNSDEGYWKRQANNR